MLPALWVDAEDLTSVQEASRHHFALGERAFEIVMARRDGSRRARDGLV